MSDYYSIQEVGGSELAEHYPDRGLISDAAWHKAILVATKGSKRFLGLFDKSEKFIVTLSANSRGLRLFESLNNFAVFLPWSDMSVVGERSTPATVVQLHMSKAPAVSFVLHLDDDSADSLFRGVMPTLPLRDPRGRLHWVKPSAIFLFIAVAVVFGATVTMLHLSATATTLAFLVAAVAISLIWIVARPLFEE